MLDRALRLARIEQAVGVEQRSLVVPAAFPERDRSFEFQIVIHLGVVNDPAAQGLDEVPRPAPSQNRPSAHYFGVVRSI